MTPGIPAKRTLALAILVALSGSISPAKQADFQTLTLAASEQHGFVLNAYPVLGRLKTGRLLCVFAVESEAKPPKMDVAVSLSDDNGKSWSKPAVLFHHPNETDADPNLLVDGDHVLAFATTVPEPGKIDRTLIYMRQSQDGLHWSEERLLKTPHRYIAGKIHQGHRLSDGTLIMGYSWDTWAEQGMPPQTEGEMNLKSGVLRSHNGGKTWTPGGDMSATIAKTSPHATSGLAEPATVVLADGKIMALMRAGGTRLFQAWSPDGGLTWTQPGPSSLTAHNSPAALSRLDGSPDIVAAWDNSPSERHPLAVALSMDGGRTWSKPKVVADSQGPQVSYPSVTQTADGMILVAWQQALPAGGREIRLARFNRAWLISK